MSFAATQNLRSTAVMARIGMQHQGERFEHPALPPGHPLRWHVLWRAQAAGWLAREAEAHRAGGAVALLKTRGG